MSERAGGDEKGFDFSRQTELASQLDSGANRAHLNDRWQRGAEYHAKSWIQMVSFEPSILMFSGAEGNTTERSILEIGEFGVNAVHSRQASLSMSAFADLGESGSSDQATLICTSRLQRSQGKHGIGGGRLITAKNAVINAQTGHGMQAFTHTCIFFHQASFVFTARL